MPLFFVRSQGLPAALQQMKEASSSNSATRRSSCIVSFGMTCSTKYWNEGVAPVKKNRWARTNSIQSHNDNTFRDCFRMKNHLMTSNKLARRGVQECLHRWWLPSIKSRFWNQDIKNATCKSGPFQEQYTGSRSNCRQRHIIFSITHTRSLGPKFELGHSASRFSKLHWVASVCSLTCVTCQRTRLYSGKSLRVEVVRETTSLPRWKTLQLRTHCITNKEACGLWSW